MVVENGLIRDSKTSNAPAYPQQSKNDAGHDKQGMAMAGILIRSHDF